MQKVRYVDPEVPSDFKKLVLRVARESKSPDASDLHRILATAEVLAFITALKHKSWSYEIEVRMIMMQSLKREASVPNMDMRPDGTPVPWREPLERDGATARISYLENPYGKFRAGK